MSAATLTPAISPAGSGSVSIVLVDEWSDDHRTYKDYKITATANAGYEYDHIEYTYTYQDLWNGTTTTETATTYSENFQYEERVAKDDYYHYGNYTLQSVTAYFKALPATYTISVSASPAAGGTVSGGGTFSGGQTCTVYAYANNGYIFVGWWDGNARVASTWYHTFNVTGNRTLVAHFHRPTNLLVNSSDKSTPVQLVYSPITDRLVGDYVP